MQRRQKWRIHASVIALAMALPGFARALEFDTGNDDLKIRWDNTLKFSDMYRLSNADPKLLSPNPNLDDGDRNFKKGSVSTRLDLLSEFDMTYRNFGLRLSGAAWYDDAYFHQTDNTSPGTYNALSVPNNQFTKQTRNLHGKRAEMQDAFVSGKFEVGEDSTLNVRAGRHTLLYGESLYLGSNGIAAAQTPIDFVRALSVANSQFKEIGLPVGQVSAQLQLTPDLALGGYYQYEWRKSRAPGAGSYFSSADILDAGGEMAFVPPALFGAPLMLRGQDIKAKNDGQFGLQAKYKLGDYDLGFYAAQYHDKTPVVYLRPSVPVGLVAGDYVLVYPQDIKVFGASMSTSVGSANVAGEMSIRKNMPLASTGGIVVATAANDGRNNPAYAVGDTFHANASVIQLFPASALWEGATLTAELGFNRRLSVTKNESALDARATRDAWGTRIVFEPQYFQVLPGVDLTVPIGLGMGLSGRSSLGPNVFGPEKGGDFSVGVSADIERVWKASLQYVQFFGPRGQLTDTNNNFSYKQTLGDRNFISLTVQRTF